MKNTVIVAIALFAAVPAWSQGAARGTSTGERAPVVIDMDADVIEGDLDKPDIVMVPRGVKRGFRSLIRVRTSFSREMLASVGQVGAGTSIGW